MREEQLALTVERLVAVDGEATYKALSARSEDGLREKLAALNVANRFVVRMWLRAPPEDWPSLAQRIDPDADQVETEFADRLIERLVSSFPQADAEARTQLPGMVRSVAAIRPAAPDEGDSDHPAISVLEDQLADPQEWTYGQGELEDEQRRFELADGLRSLGPEASERIEEALVAAVIRGLESPFGPMESSDVATTLLGAVELSQTLAEASLTRIANTLPEFDPATDIEAASAEVLARCELAAVLDRRDMPTIDSLDVARDKVVAVASADAALRDRAIGAWLGRGSPVEIALAVLAPVPRSLSHDVTEGLKAWSQVATKAQRTALVRKLIGSTRRRRDAIAAIALCELNESALSRHLASEIVAAGNEASRRQLIDETRAIGFGTQNAGQVLSEATRSLLAPGRAKSDISVAVELVRAIPAEHLKRQVVASAFKNACERHDYQLKGPEVTALTDAGVSVTKKMVKKRLRDRIPKPKVPNPFSRS